MFQDLDEDLSLALLPMFMRPGMYLGTNEDTEENRKALISMACVYASITKMMRHFGHDMEKEVAYAADDEGFPLKGEFSDEEIDWIKKTKQSLEEEVFAGELWRILLWEKQNMVSNETH